MGLSGRFGATGMLLLVGLGGVGGCVDRRFVITTDPPGAIVYDEKNLPMGASPADRQFTYYGKYRFTLVKDGFQTQIVEENVKSPWYEFFPLDFITENLIPFPIRDVRHFHYQMQPAQLVPPEEVLNQGMQLRQRGQGIGPPPRPLPPETPANQPPSAMPPVR
jgi:hypothetical protein